MIISIIVAMDKNRAIGTRGSLPWTLPADLAHFKQTTIGHPIIMGRKTFDSIGRALPRRTNIIISRDKTKVSDTFVCVSSLREAIDLAKRCEGSDEIFIIGGGEIFNQAIGLVDKLYVTEVVAEVSGADIFFPAIYDNIWEEKSREHHKKDEKNEFDYDFVIYERR